MTFIENIWTRLRSMQPLHLTLALFVLSLALRLAFVLVFHTYRNLDRYELERTALSIARQGIYGNPYAIPTGPTAHVSPGYTVILAGIFRLFGSGTSGEIVKQALACAISSAGYALVPLAAGALRLSRTVGVVASLVCIAFPAKPLVQMDGDWETPYTGLFISLCLLLAVIFWRATSPSLRAAALRGVTWGLALLFASVLLPVFVSFQVAGAWFHRKQIGTYLRPIAVEVVIALGCLSPWIIRNLVVLGKPIATRSNLGIELRVSNNDEAVADQRENYIRGVYALYHPLLNAGEAAKVRDQGEVAYNSAAQKKTEAWIKNHPKRFAELTASRIWSFWFYNDPTSRLKTLFLALTGALGLAGAILLFRRSIVSGVGAGLILLLYPAPNYLIHVGLRQRYPIDWLLVLLSVFIIYEMRRRRRTNQIS